MPTLKTCLKSRVLYAALGFLALSSVGAAGNTLAQALPQPPDYLKNLSDEEFNRMFGEEAPNETAACFEWYKFQSVALDFKTNKNNYPNGESVTFSGTLENKNNYPLVEGVLRVRIFRTTKRPLDSGADAVEEFEALRGLTLGPQERKPVSFKYDLPKTMVGGNYVANFYFDVADKFNLAGLPFTEDVIGGMARFVVIGRETGLFFDKSSISINGRKQHQAAGFSQEVESDRPVDIAAALKNETKQDKKIAVRYELYRWSAQEKNNLLDSREETFSLKAGRSQALNFKIENPPLPVYYLKIKARSEEDERNEINLRILTSQFRPRINFAGISKIPTERNSPTTLFACFHNTSSSIKAGKIKLQLLDSNEKTILSETSRSTAIGSHLLFLKGGFIPNTSYRKVTLRAELLDQTGQMVDAVTLKYDCSDIKSMVCPRDFRILYYALGALVLILLILGARKLLKRRQINPVV